MGAVDGDIGEVVEDPAGLIIGWWSSQQVDVLADEVGGDPPVLEVLLAQQGTQEPDVGGHPADGELGQGTLGTGHGGGEVGAAAGGISRRIVVSENFP